MKQHLRRTEYEGMLIVFLNRFNNPNVEISFLWKLFAMLSKEVGILCRDTLLF